MLRLTKIKLIKNKLKNARNFNKDYKKITFSSFFLIFFLLFLQLGVLDIHPNYKSFFF